MTGISGLRLIWLLLFMGVAMPWSAGATTASTSLDDKLMALDDMSSWQHVARAGAQLRGHPNLSPKQLESLIESLG
ncbi:hypothetical protein CWC05_21920, partial [Pseudoalteromonas ruthenica]